MSDFLQHMALLNIESQIASTGRKVAQAATEAGQAAARATQDQTRKLEKHIASIRTDMLEGFGGVEAQVRVLTTDMGKGLRALDHNLHENRLALSRLEASMDVVSDNLVIGFDHILNRLEGIENTLSRIETGVMNPEQTRALERYRTARKLAEAGRPIEAMNHIQSAITNDGGLPLTHLPELMVFRAVLRIGQHDTASESVFDGPGALADLEEAIVFAAPAAKRILKLKLAAARFALQDFQGAFSLYESLATGNKKSFARFQMARCNFAMSRPDAAADICRALLREDISTALLFASDPLCQEHAELFVQIAAEERKRRLPAIIAFLKQVRALPSVEDLRASLAEAFQEMIDLPGKVIGSGKDLETKYPEMREANRKIAEIITRETRVVVRVGCGWDEAWREEFKDSLSDFKHALTKLDDCISKCKLDFDTHNLTLDIQAEWTDVATALRQCSDIIVRHSYLTKELRKLHEVGLRLVDKGWSGRKCDFTLRGYVETDFSPETIESLKPARANSLLSVLRSKSSPSPKEQEGELLRRKDALRKEIIGSLDGIHQNIIARLMTRELELRLEPLRAVVDGFPDLLGDVAQRLEDLDRLAHELCKENKQMLDGLKL